MRLGPDPAIGRLTRRSEFLTAASGRRFHSARLSLQGSRRDGDTSARGLRVGLTVTKRVGHATERNRIRRRLRRAVTEAGQAYAADPVDVVIVGRREALGSPFGALVDDLTKGLRIVTRPRSRDAAPTAKGEPALAPSAEA